MKIISYYIVALVGIFYSCSNATSEKDYNSVHKVTLKCTYPGYTSPDFGSEREPNFLIDISSIREHSLPSDELVVDFITDSLDLLFHEENKQCPICYDYYLTGELKWVEEKKYNTLMVDSFYLVADSSLFEK